MRFAEIILPVKLPRPTFTYLIPPELAEKVQKGVRVELNFGKNKLFAGIVAEIHDRKVEDLLRIKSILGVLDDTPVVTESQLNLWRWMAEYYCCTLGEVMAAALPAHLKLSSETSFIFNENFGDDFSELSDDEYLIAEALLIQKEISIDDVRAILSKKTVFPVLKMLLERGVLFHKEEIQEKYRPKTVSCVRLAEPYFSQNERLKDVFKQVEKSEKQSEILLYIIQNSRKKEAILKGEMLKKIDSPSALNTLVKKGFVEIYDKEISRIGGYEEEIAAHTTMSPAQTRAYEEILTNFESKNVVLLNGVTGSGKTRIYVELMKKTIAEGGQVLYLLPEIALTTQIISRLQLVFGNDIIIYHSKVNNNERVEVWRSAVAGKPIILGARSSVFLPFSNLKLIIIDEEHDSSFKQNDPDPRYSGRDAAIYLAAMTNAKTLLGTATPSVESWHSAVNQKYGLVLLNERFGGLKMPEIELLDLKKATERKEMNGPFSLALLENLKRTISAGEQVILFQNRRGFAPTYLCQDCNWKSQCKNCDVSLTYHQQSTSLRCHYCGFQQELPKKCPVCASAKLKMIGFGTEKIEEDLKLLLPNARVARMDLDTVSGKTALTKLISDFEERRLDILVGTQMVTKGLDFENVGLVGVILADALMGYPDFRANERAFQLLTQVSGRAGRKNKQGRVLIQTWNPAHPVLNEVVRGDWKGFFLREINERKTFDYPPFNRIIHISIKHKKPETCFDAAKLLAIWLKKSLGDRVQGPAVPGIARVRTLYCMDLLIKIERDMAKLKWTKQLILETAQKLVGESGYGSVRIEIDVDPN
jgi:primosomal protein N' (replication factor Y) (superfamily II helicase)